MLDARVIFEARLPRYRLLLRVLSPLLRPLFRWNHNWYIRRAQEGLGPYAQNLSAGRGVERKGRA